MDILDRFIGQARINVESGYYDLGRQTSYRRLSLRKSLESREFSLIAEIKHRSPVGEYSFIDIDAKKASLDFRDAGADAISVVVEPAIFRGTLANVAAARSAGIPVLFKDFVISRLQIVSAERSGADAVLLIARVFDRLGISPKVMIDYCHSLGLEVLLECYDEGEMERAAQTDADLLGINSRDLRTLKVDIGRAAGILKRVKSDKPIVSESGIRTGNDAMLLRQSGAKGILVGTAIWTAQDMRAKIRELKGLR